MNKLKELHLSGKAKIGLVILLLILLTSVLAPVLAPYDPLVSNLSEALQKPSAAHLLGTDNIGRDTLSRVLYGGRQSILLALAATVLSMLLGFALGLFAGYFGGWIDGIITTISSIFQGLPGLTLMIAVAGLLGQGVKSMLIAIVINSWVGFSRIVRGEVMKLKQESFIKGLRTIGAGDLRILVPAYFSEYFRNSERPFCHQDRRKCDLGGVHELSWSGTSAPDTGLGRHDQRCETVFPPGTAARHRSGTLYFASFPRHQPSGR